MKNWDTNELAEILFQDALAIYKSPEVVGDGRAIWKVRKRSVKAVCITIFS